MIETMPHPYEHSEISEVCTVCGHHQAHLFHQVAEHGDIEAERDQLVGRGLLPNPNQMNLASWSRVPENDPRINSYQQLVDSYAMEIMLLREQLQYARTDAIRHNRVADRRANLLQWLREHFAVEGPLVVEMFDYAFSDE